MSDYKPRPIPALSQKDIDRFWNRVVKGEPDECWPWFGSVTADGYGNFWIGRSNFNAHRVSYFIATGNDLYPLLGRHTCDHKWCVNYSHIIPGTHKQNSADAVERNRLNNTFAQKLTELQVSSILVDRGSGMSIPDLCRKYEITMGAIIPIIKGRTWRRVVGVREKQKPHLTFEVRQAIRIKRKQGATLESLSKEFGMSLGAIGMLVARQTWASDPE